MSFFVSVLVWMILVYLSPQTLWSGPWWIQILISALAGLILGQVYADFKSYLRNRDDRDDDE